MLDPAANSVGNRDNFVPFGFSFAFDLQILEIFYLWNTISFWCFFLGSDVLSVVSAANSVGNTDIISYHLAFPSQVICKYWRSFISGTLYLLVLFWGSDVLSVGFSSQFPRKDIISFHLAFPSHMIYTYWRSFISGKLYLLVLFGGSDVLSVGFSG